MDSNSKTRHNSVSNFMRSRENKSAYAKFSILKNIMKRKKNHEKNNGKPKERNPYVLLLKRLFIVGAFVFLLTVLAGSIVLAIWVSNVSKELVGIDPDAPFKNAANVGDTLIYSKDGVELKRLTGLESRDFIKIDDVPDYVKAAFVAAEDKSFYENKGVDLLGIGRAAIGAIQKKEIVGGGSTITQQVVKTTLVGDKQNLDRKLKELILSVQIAQKYSKDQVLQLYINSISFGSNFIGVKRAAKAYFNKDVKDLTYGEAALLAGIPNNPAKLAPDGYQAVDLADTFIVQSDGTKVKANIVRKNEILDRMNDIVDQLAIYPGIKLDRSKIKAAHSDPIVYNYPKTEAKAPHFTREGGPVYNELLTIFKDKPNIDQYITSSGLRVYTTLDYDMQQKAEASVAQIDDNTNKIPSSVCAYCSYGLSNPTPWNVFGAKDAAMISVNPKTGAVLAYAGSSGFDRSDDQGMINGQVDILQQGVSQGSSMKPFNYLSSFINKGLAPSSTWANFPIDMGGGYKPKNFSIGDHPSISVTSAYALNNSLNIPAVQALITGGVDNYAALLSKFGYSDDEISEIKKAGVTATLGAAVIKPYDHAQAYQVLANAGVKKTLYVIDKITDKDGNEVYHKKDDPGIKVVDEKYVWQITNILENYPTVQVIKKDGYDAAGKTGTNDFGPNGYPTSNVFWGFTPDLVTGIWAGNSGNQPLRQFAVGEKLGQFLWTPYMKAVLPKFPKTKFVRPSGIVEKVVCQDTGFLADDSTPCDKTNALFVDGQFPKKDDNHKKYRVVDCNGTTKLASPADELAGLAKDQFFIKYESLTGIPNIQKQIDDYATNVLGQPAPPTDTCTDPRTSDGTDLTKITQPAPNTVFNAGDNVNITVSSVAQAGTALFYFDDAQIGSSSTVPFSASYTLPTNINDGNHTIRVQVTDSAGKTGTATTIIITKQSGNTSTTNIPAVVQVLSPTGNVSKLSTNQSFIASVTPNTNVNNLHFMFRKKGDTSYITFNNDPQAGKQADGNYYATIDLFHDTHILPGQEYEVIAVIPNGTQSNPVTIKVN